MICKCNHHEGDFVSLVFIESINGRLIKEEICYLVSNQ